MLLLPACAVFKKGPSSIMCNVESMGGLAAHTRYTHIVYFYSFIRKIVRVPNILKKKIEKAPPKLCLSNFGCKVFEF